MFINVKNCLSCQNYQKLSKLSKIVQNRPKSIVAKSIKNSTSPIFVSKNQHQNARFTTFLNLQQNRVNAFEISNIGVSCWWHWCQQQWCQLLEELVLATLVLFAGWTGAIFSESPVLLTVFSRAFPKNQHQPGKISTNRLARFCNSVSQLIVRSQRLS